MNLTEMEAKVASAVQAFFALETAPPVSATLSSLGCDSLDAVELTLDLEEHFPEADLGPFIAEQKMTISDIAAEIVKFSVVA